jgi:hypothetical protein
MKLTGELRVDADVGMVGSRNANHVKELSQKGNVLAD